MKFSLRDKIRLLESELKQTKLNTENQISHQAQMKTQIKELTELLQSKGIIDNEINKHRKYDAKEDVVIEDVELAENNVEHVDRIGVSTKQIELVQQPESRGSHASDFKLPSSRRRRSRSSRAQANI